MGVQAVLGGEIAWYSEVDKGALKILEHRFPGVPNVGDITAVDWSTVEPVDILTGGSPCQDLSHAGKRTGMTEGTRSNLWVAMREAIAQLRPRTVVWENVRGAGSAEATSDLEFCPGCMGDGRPGVVLRALGRVVGDLSDLGYVGQVRGLRAADVGGPHGRFRYFLAASPADADHQGPWSTGSERGRWSRAQYRVGSRQSDLTLLPTPAVNDMGKAYTPETWDAWCAEQQAKPDRWGQYTAAIHRWEALTRPAPPPAETGPKGNPRLSAAFSEWLMGLPAGWVTDIPGITRNEALKALGNGVVPQQGAEAIRRMLAWRTAA